MKRFTVCRAAGVAVALAGAMAAPALARPAPNPTISFHGGSVAFIAGVHWGSGKLNYRGHRYALKVSGLQVGAIGANSFDATGEVYNLHRVADIEGTYGAVEASATAGAGAGAVDMKNDKGVEIKANTSSAGLKLSLGPQGVVIKLNH